MSNQPEAGRVGGDALPKELAHLPNPYVMAPMATAMGAPGGVPSSRLLDYYARHARGGVSVLITEAALAVEHPAASKGRIGLWVDEQIGPMSELAEVIRAGGALPVAQIADVGLRASKRTPDQMTRDEIHELVQRFAQACYRARQAGFAGVEVHAGHSITFADFLSRRANTRSDEYGGGDENRARIVSEAVRAARQLVGEDYLLLCRFSADEYTVNGNTLKQTIPIAQALLAAGVDVLHVSAGNRNDDGGGRKSYSNLRGRPAAWLPDGPNLHLAREIKRSTGAPVIAVGKLGNPEVAKQALAEGDCDLVALGRPLLAEPDWVRKVEAGEQINRCLCCDKCMDIFLAGEPLHCPVYHSGL